MRLASYGQACLGGEVRIQAMLWVTQHTVAAAVRAAESNERSDELRLRLSAR
jgi:hypothetical protein